MEQPKGAAETTDEASRLHSRKDPNTGNLEAVTERKSEGRKCNTVHIPNRSFRLTVNHQTLDHSHTHLFLHMFIYL